MMRFLSFAFFAVLLFSISTEDIAWAQANKPAVKKSDATSRELGVAIRLIDVYLSQQIREDGSLISTRRLKDAKDLQISAPEAELLTLRALIRLQQQRADFMRADLIERALRYWEGHLRSFEDKGELALMPEGVKVGLTIRHAMLILVYSDLMEVKDQLGEKRALEVEAKLNAMLAFLLKMRRDDGHFYSTFDDQGRPGDKNHPDADAQALNALTREAIRRGESGEALRREALNSAEAMYQAYMRVAVRDGALMQLVTVYAVHSLEAHVLLAGADWKMGGMSMTQNYRNVRTSEVASWAIKTVSTFGRQGAKEVRPDGRAELNNAAIDMMVLGWCWKFAFMTRDVRMRDQLRNHISPRLDDLMRRQVGNPMQADYVSRSAINPEMKGAMVEGIEMPVARIMPLACFLLGMRVANDFGYGK